ncbi:hypothetical protein SAMN05421780_101448 [Flexibacter flexilis DSM 6793]|uniref:Nucleoid-associated protein SAMN05421780_101448 n=1 Tax=Flexibacter flexilis DSM 6793 TaxID=927664 RepID=A0A1I1DT86_9BACT|nr:YbaB/EbfC family nucleoid-associated protein [Flexibacter flexilis]SFB78064.1 hypothetical protein SAMN05421780_101448 [Flexibacter flexilis DSM 6793]
MFDMMKMMGKLKEAQEKMRVVQEELAKLTHTAEAGAGMVKATVNGKRQVLKIEIDEDLCKPEDRQTIQDLTVAAINKALADMDEKIKQEMMKSTEGLLPNIPGFDLSNM